MNILNNLSKLGTFDDYDSATIGSVILGIGDIVWLSYDVVKNGFTTPYMVIALLFLIGNILLIVGLSQHHAHIKSINASRKQRKADKEDSIIHALEQEANQQ